MTLTLVAAVGGNGVIGRGGDLPWPRTGDLAHFRALTMGHVLLMGRTTYDSIGRPLPGRTTVVLTRQADWSAPGVRVAHDLESALALTRTLDGEVFVVGGAQLYTATLPIADRLVLTRVEQSPPGDTFFPHVDWSVWQEVSSRPYAGFSIDTYDRVYSAPGRVEAEVGAGG